MAFGFGDIRVYTAQTTNITLENRPSQKETIVFQPSIFRCREDNPHALLKELPGLFLLSQIHQKIPPTFPPSFLNSLTPVYTTLQFIPFLPISESWFSHLLNHQTFFDPRLQMCSDRIQEGHSITCLWRKQQIIQGHSPNSTTGFSTIFSTCQQVWEWLEILEWLVFSGRGIGLGLSWGVAGWKMDDQYLDDRCSTWRVCVFNGCLMDLIDANTDVSPKCKIILRGFLYKKDLLMVMSVIWCHISYTLRGKHHISSEQHPMLHADVKTSNKSSFQQKLGLICCKIL